MNHLLALSGLSSSDAAVLLALLLGAIVLYLVYKVAWKPDFGMPVRRRITSMKMTINRDQVAYVPLWWSNLQVQRAIRSHWKDTLRRTASGRSAKEG